VILIGEMRDAETDLAAMTGALTATWSSDLHTIGRRQTIAASSTVSAHQQI